MLTLPIVLLILAAACFLDAALNSRSRVNLTAFGLALATAAAIALLVR